MRLAHTLLGRFAGIILAAATLIGAPMAARAAPPTDPAAVQIDAFDAALLDVLKEAKTLGIQGRYRKLQPIVTRFYDMPTMIRFAVGAGWSAMTPAQQAALTDGFARLNAASYAHNFTAYSGQQFQIDPNVVTRGPDKVVQTRLVSPHDAPISISYRMRQSGGTWKIIDVYYGGSISQLTTRRADFAASVAQGGAPALLAHLNQLVDRQLK